MEKQLILIVDDVGKNLQVLGNILRDAGYELAVASNGEQALDFVKKCVPDLILLDVMMPGWNGFETCEKIREHLGNFKVPVIFLTALDDSSDIEKGFELGAVDYITKPFRAPELMARVKTHLEMSRRAKQIAFLGEERKTLLHVLCHDLNNTFGALGLSLDLFLKTGRTEFADSIKTSLKNGTDLISFVRKMSHLEEKKLTLSPQLFTSAMEQSVELLSGKIGEKDLRISYEGDPDFWVEAEPVSLMNSVLNNILTNAIKFSYRGGVIKISVSHTEEQLLVGIRDYGRGMPEMILNEVLTPHKIYSKEGTEGEVGTGFGLALVEKFMLAYGGSIKIESWPEEEYEEESGTQVTLSFKRCAPAED
jgi:two-component system sensor histidine kinase/response regulator